MTHLKITLNLFVGLSQKSETRSTRKLAMNWLREPPRAVATVQWLCWSNFSGVGQIPHFEPQKQVEGQYVIVGNYNLKKKKDTTDERNN